MADLSPHFSLAELTRTARGLPNTPGAAEVERLRRLCAAVLEPLRLLWGGLPVRVNSGYRSELVNRAIGGAAASQHLRGEAADIVPPGDAEQAFAQLAEAVKDHRLTVDQAIIYKSGFIHVSYTATRNRGQLLRSLAGGGSGGPYIPYDGPA